MRDYQRQRLYDAEDILRTFYDRAEESGNPMVTMKGFTVTLPPEAKFGSVESLQTYVDRVLDHPRVIDAVGTRSRVTVQAKKEHQALHRATYSKGRILIPNGRNRWAMREVVVLHELAHHCSHDRHGPNFAAAFLSLLGAVMGPEVELICRVLFDDGGVDYRVPVTTG